MDFEQPLNYFPARQYISDWPDPVLCSEKPMYLPFYLSVEKRRYGGGGGGDRFAKRGRSSFGGSSRGGSSGKLHLPSPDNQLALSM